MLIVISAKIVQSGMGGEWIANKMSLLTDGNFMAEAVLKAVLSKLDELSKSKVIDNMMDRGIRGDEIIRLYNECEDNIRCMINKLLHNPQRDWTSMDEEISRQWGNRARPSGPVRKYTR